MSEIKKETKLEIPETNLGSVVTASEFNAEIGHIQEVTKEAGGLEKSEPVVTKTPVTNQEVVVSAVNPQFPESPPELVVNESFIADQLLHSDPLKTSDEASHLIDLLKNTSGPGAL